MLKKIINIFLILIIGSPVMGQVEVRSKAYAKKLNFLLSHKVEEISVKDAAVIADKVIFLDSREKSEYDVSHLKNAKWVGYKGFDAKKLKDVPKNSKIIIYCSVGYRSEKITAKLNKLGYKNVSNLYGGIFEWVNQGNKVYNNDGEVTLKVHTYNKRWGKWLNRGVKVY